eukprot:Anaeramoba_ignava/a90613_22.p1 GENE.a90613_22~~a90613_22.p1  ORF type:complete len:326 (-),score=64.94 a90613_22:312-1289(-)
MQEIDEFYSQNEQNNQPDLIQEQSDSDDDQFEGYISYENLDEYSDDNRMKILTNFDLTELQQLFYLVAEAFQVQGRGARRTTLSDETTLLMTLVWLKHYPSWNRLGSDFGISQTWARDLVTDTLQRIEPILVQDQIRWIGKAEQEAQGSSFAEFPNVLGIVDVTCQRCQRPKDRFEQKKYFSGKHKCHVIKSQTINSCSGLCMSFFTGVEGSIHDLRIFEISGESAMFQSYSIMADKGYIGIQHSTQAEIPFKKPRGGNLDLESEFYNATIARTRIVIEHYYARMKNFWGSMNQVWRGERVNLYSTTFGICAALTNYHIRNGNPL